MPSKKLLPLGKLRILDADDLIVMDLLLQKVSCAKIAKTLGLTPAAISHRRRRYSELFGEDFYELRKDLNTNQSFKHLSLKGETICSKMRALLEILIEIEESI